MKPGKYTSEFKLAKATKWVNMAALAAGGIMTAFSPDTPAYAILAAVVAMANAWTSSAYTRSRREVKAEEIRAGVAS